MGEKMYNIPAAKDAYQLNFSRLPRQNAPKPLSVTIKINNPLESISPPRKGIGRRINLIIQSVS